MKTNENYCIIAIDNLYQQSYPQSTISAINSDGEYTQTSHDQNDMTVYDSVEEAQEVIDNITDDIYVCVNTEAGRPDYYILEQSDADYIMSGRNGDGSNYDWDEDHTCDCEDGTCDKCFNLMQDQDEEYIKSRAIEVEN